MKEHVKRLIRFVIVGGSATGIDAVLYMLLSMRWSINLSKTLSMLIACVYSFFLQKKWTFQAKGSVVKQVVLYAGVQIVNIVVNVKTNEQVYILLENKVYAFIIATAFASLVNYILQKAVVFRE